MNIPSIACLSSFCILTFAIFAQDTPLGGISAQAKQSPLELRLARISGRVFEVALHNTATTALVLNVGVMAGNGRQQYATRIRLLLETPENRLLDLESVDRPAIAGRTDPMVVPLPAGATFMLRPDLDRYCAPGENLGVKLETRAVQSARGIFRSWNFAGCRKC